MRHHRVVAGVALIAMLAAVAVPGLAQSQPPSSDAPIDPAAFTAVRVDGAPGPTTTLNLTLLPDPFDAFGDFATQLPESARRAEAPARADATPTPAPTTKPVLVRRWHVDPEVSWYGPGFYGRRTACGLALTTSTLGVANRTLPCGTLVTFRNPANGRTVTVRVVDRGPYVSGRQWDLTGAACLALGHCYTGEILWRMA